MVENLRNVYGENFGRRRNTAFDNDIRFFTSYRQKYRNNVNNNNPTPEEEREYNEVKERLFTYVTNNVINNPMKGILDILQFINNYKILRSFTYIEELYTKLTDLRNIKRSGEDYSRNGVNYIKYVDNNSDLLNIPAVIDGYDLFLLDAETYFTYYNDRANRKGRGWDQQRYDQVKIEMYNDAMNELRGKSSDEILEFFINNPIYEYIGELRNIKNDAERNRAPPPRPQPQPSESRAPPPRPQPQPQPSESRAPPPRPPPRDRASPQQPPESNRAPPPRPPPAAAAPIENCPAATTEIPEKCESKSQYKNLAKKLHPDKNSGCPDIATKKMQDLNNNCENVKGGSKNKSKAKKRKSKSVKKRQSRKSNK